MRSFRQWLAENMGGEILPHYNNDYPGWEGKVRSQYSATEPVRTSDSPNPEKKFGVRRRKLKGEKNG